MISIAAVVFLAGLGGQEPQPPTVSEAGLVQTVDTNAYGRCVGGLVGFTNVPIQCTVSEDGSLTACQLNTRNRGILRYKRRFDCMASAITVSYPDGAPAAGRTVSLRLSAYTAFYNPN